MQVKKLYIVQHHVFAKNVSEAIKVAAGNKPDEVFISDEWKQKSGFIQEKEDHVNGFGKNV